MTSSKKKNTNKLSEAMSDGLYDKDVIYDYDIETKAVLDERVEMRDYPREYFDENSTNHVLPPEEQKLLAIKAQNGDIDARHKLVHSNQKLVEYKAKKYESYGKKCGIESCDIVQDGILGLLNAIDGFDPSKGKFSTYAGICIEREIMDSFDRMSNVAHIPGNDMNAFKKMKKRERELAAELEHEPSIVELADDLGITEKKIMELMRISLDADSIDTVPGEEDTYFADKVLEDKTNDSTEDIVESIIQGEAIEKLLNRIPARDRNIVKLLYGFDGEKPWSISEVMDKYELKRGRVVKIRDDAIETMKHLASEEGLIGKE